MSDVCLEDFPVQLIQKTAIEAIVNPTLCLSLKLSLTLTLIPVQLIHKTAIEVKVRCAYRVLGLGPKLKAGLRFRQRLPVWRRIFRSRPKGPE